MTMSKSPAWQDDQAVSQSLQLAFAYFTDAEEALDGSEFDTPGGLTACLGQFIPNIPQESDPADL